MIEIGIIREDELEALAHLLEELVGEKSDEIKMREHYRRMMTNSAYTLLGARVDGELAGTVMGIECMDLVGDCKPFMVLENVVVSGKFRGKGIGHGLMAAMEAAARQKGCAYIMFVSSGYRKQAHKFYASVGYSLDAVQGFRKLL